MQNMFGLDFGFSIFWMWLNFTGFFLAVAVAYLVTALTKTKAKVMTEINHVFKWNDLLTKEPIILISFFVIILGISYMIPTILG
jgi:sodium-coupled monocarboxylate transporter 8/12